MMMMMRTVTINNMVMRKKRMTMMMMMAEAGGLRRCDSRVTLSVMTMMDDDRDDGPTRSKQPTWTRGRSL